MIYYIIHAVQFLISQCVLKLAISFKTLINHIHRYIPSYNNNILYVYVHTCVLYVWVHTQLADY